ncbi:peptidoglycan recognition protein family protein [Streptosporangium sandarakinum]
MAVISRRAWGARAPRGSYTTIRSTRGVKVHYTGGAVSPATLDDHDRCLALMRRIQDHHMDGNGWLDFAYSMAACVHGDVLVGRGPGHLVAANGEGLNRNHYAVVGLIGSKGVTEPTPELLHGIRDAIEILREDGGAGQEIKGHRDGYATDCPGGPLYAWVQAGAPRPGVVRPPVDAGGVPQWPGRLLIYTPGVPLAKGDDVLAWQRQMTRIGYHLEADGLYGPRSASTCMRFQGDQHLAPRDAIVGPATWRATFTAKPK